MKLFISHVRSSSAWSEWIARTLIQAGHQVFYDGWDLQPGDNIIQYIDSALNTSEMTVLVVDERYFESAWAANEWTASFAKAGAGSLLVVRTEPVEIPGLLGIVRSIDLFGHSEAEARDLLLGSVTAVSSTPREPQPLTFPGNQKIYEEKTATMSPDISDSVVFVSYSHKDKRWLDRLLVHVKPLERSGILDIWSDRRIAPGQVWKHEIESALNRAKAAVLLISADFLASDFIVEYELAVLLAMAKSKGTVILPLIVSPSRFTKYEELSRFQAFNPPGVPLSKMTTHGREELLVLLTDRIEDILTN